MSIPDTDESGSGVAARMLHAFVVALPFGAACGICGRGLRDRVHLESLDVDVRGLPSTSSDLVVAVSRAQPIRDGMQPPVPTTTLVLGGLGEVPSSGGSQDDFVLRERARAEARAVLLALRRSLPGATLDQVEVALLTERASRLVVRHDDVSYVVTRRPLAYLALLSAALAGRPAPPALQGEGRRSSGHLTWRDLCERLDQLRRSCEQAGVDSAMDEEVVVRVEDDRGDLCVGGLRSVDVDAGCSDVLALVLDGDRSSGPRSGSVAHADGDTRVTPDV